MNIQPEQSPNEMLKSGHIYVSSEVILYSIKDISRMTGLGYGSVNRLFDDPDFASIYYGRLKLIENHALMKFFSVRRDKETKIFRVRIDRDPWRDDIYDNYYSSFPDEYIQRRKTVDDLQLNWLDAAAEYYSPEVAFFTKEEILEQSDWTAEEVTLLFADPRFPRTEYANKKIVEVHALIQFFARKALVKQNQLAESERREAFLHSCAKTDPSVKYNYKEVLHHVQTKIQVYSR